jgi:sugar lactone lactonase YvrE
LFFGLAIASILFIGRGQILEAQTSYTPYFFETLAGDFGTTNGPPTTVRLGYLNGIALDGKGNLFFTDSNSIQKLSASGIVSTVAGTQGAYGSADGTGPSAQFATMSPGYPLNIAVDGDGDVYVSDFGNDTIRRITPGGIVTTLAGTPGVQGSADGPGSVALFNGPLGIAVDASDNLYVADSGNSTIREISPSGMVTTIAGVAGATGTIDGVGSSARFESPSAIALDGAGNIYVSAVSLRKIAAGDVVTTLSGGDAYGSGGLAVDSGGNVYVSSSSTNSIVEISPSGAVSTFAAASGAAVDGFTPIYYGLAVDGAGSVYVADAANYRILKITQQGTASTIVGAPYGGGYADGTGTAATFSYLAGVAVDGSGTLYVADQWNNTIRKIAPGGVVTTVAGTPGITGSADGTGAAAQFSSPDGVALDSSGNLFVADQGNDTIRKITPAGVVTTFAGSPGGKGSADGTGSAARFDDPQGIGVDHSGNVFVADSGNFTIREISPSGVVTTLVGSPGVIGNADGTGAAAQFFYPVGIAVDGTGNVFVSDGMGFTIDGNLYRTNYFGDTIRKVTPGGLVTTLAGLPQDAGSADGAGSAALFNSPAGVAVDGAGNVFVADSLNQTIRRISPAGAVTTLAGVPEVQGTADGMGAAVRFNSPSFVAVDNSGNLYVTDSDNFTIRVGALGRAPSVATEPALGKQAASQTVAAGRTAVFSVASSAVPNPAYQWFFDGTPLAGATQATLIVDDATAAEAGFYDCVATNLGGTTTSSATLTVAATSDPGRLINLSCRSLVGAGQGVLIAGFAIGGAGVTGSETLLVRASGPALIPFGVTGVLPDPTLQLISSNSNSLLAASNGWDGNALVASTAAAVGAFPWVDPSSRDSGLIESLPAGPYTGLVAGASGDSGIALAELYDATPGGTYSPSSPRLINISARTQVGVGDNVLIAGFVIGGTTSETVLIRASGPALIPFGVSGILPDPQLQLSNSGGMVATNTGWGGDNQIAAAAESVGAFSWGTSSTPDSAILITLPPGAYTAEVSGASSDTGTTLVEVYEVQ